MTRKTFIKQAMAAGVQRNAAALAAQSAIQRGEPYHFALGRLLNFRAMITGQVIKAARDLLLYGNAEVNPGEALRLFYPWEYEKLAPIPVGKMQVVNKAGAATGGLIKPYPGLLYGQHPAVGGGHD